MNKVTVIRDDGAVYVDGSAVTGLPAQAWDAMPADVWALQWDEALGTGEIEFSPADGVRPPNERITQLPSWAQDLVTARAAHLAQIEGEINE